MESYANLLGAKSDHELQVQDLMEFLEAEPRPVLSQVVLAALVPLVVDVIGADDEGEQRQDDLCMTPRIY